MTITLSLSFSTAHSQTDSIQSIIAEIPDPIPLNWQKTDSICNAFNEKVDSIQVEYQKVIAPINVQETIVMKKIDSLRQKGNSTGKLTQQLDSLKGERKKITNDLSAKTDTLKSKTINQLDKIQVTPEMEVPMKELRSNINNAGLENPGNIEIPTLDIQGLPKIPTKEIPLNPALIATTMSVPEIETTLGSVNEIKDQLSGVSEDVKKITQGNLNKVQQLPKSIEEQAAKIDGIQNLQEQSGIIEEYRTELTSPNDPEALKTQAQEMLAKEAVNHFAGREDQLKSAMATLSKFKEKYSSVTSLFELPKRVPNAMKGVPFIERFVPGFYLQYQKKNLHLADINPYLAYKVSGRFVPGLGWNHRYGYDGKNKSWPGYSRIYGPRIFLDTRMGKGFIAHLEQEAMNTLVPNRFTISGDYGKREWVWSTFIGLKKEYTIYKNFKGTVLIQYNLIHRYFKTPYVDRLNSRLGFEYTLKKKQRS